MQSVLLEASGDEPDSLFRFLGTEEEELKDVLRLCKVYNGEKDNISKNNFELLMGCYGTHWTHYHFPGAGKAERFIKIGIGTDIMLPKDQYAMDGTLCCYPVEDKHIQNLRTRSQRGTIPKLVDLHVPKGNSIG